MIVFEVEKKKYISSIFAGIENTSAVLNVTRITRWLPQVLMFGQSN